MPQPVSRQLEGRDIICFANDWDSDPLSKKHIMTRLARRNRVLWVNSIGTRNPQASMRDVRRALGKLRQAFRTHRQVAGNLFVYSPAAIPFHGNSFARWINIRWLSWSIRRVARRLEFHDPITWTFLPTTAGVAGCLGEQAVIYHCVDEFSEFTGSHKQALLAMERQLMKRAAAVIVSSQALLETKQAYNPNTFLVTHGVDVRHFAKAFDPTTVIPQEVASLPRPIVGFFGLIADWVDLDLIRYLALARPRWSFVLIGKHDTSVESVAGLSNVYLLGQKGYRELPAYCKAFDVAMLPFAVNKLTRAANPLKLREYLAAGLRVVSTAIPEAERLQDVRVARTHSEFLAHADQLVNEARCTPRRDIAAAMDRESWDGKVDQMVEIVSRIVPPASADGADRIPTADMQEICPGRF
jgi:hypothetical protein